MTKINNADLGADEDNLEDFDAFGMELIYGQEDMIWFEYPNKDSVYLKDFMHVLYTETIKVFPDDLVNVSEIDGTVYITIE